MSGGDACCCPGPLRERKDNWFVIDRECNYSAFSGYQQTPSRYSSIGCRECRSMWRTKASYVPTLRDGSIEELR